MICGGWESKHRIEIPKPILSQIPPPKGRSACVSVWYLFTEPYPQWNLRWQASQRLYWALKAYAQASGCEGVLRRLKRAVGFRIWGLHILYSRKMGALSKVSVALCSFSSLFILSSITWCKLAIFKDFDDFFCFKFYILSILLHLLMESFISDNLTLLVYFLSSRHYWAFYRKLFIYWLYL